MKGGENTTQRNLDRQDVAFRVKASASSSESVSLTVQAVGVDRGVIARIVILRNDRIRTSQGSILNTERRLGTISCSRQKDEAFI